MGLAEKYGTQTVKGNESPLSLETVFFHAIGGRVPLGIKPSFVFWGKEASNFQSMKNNVGYRAVQVGL